MARSPRNLNAQTAVSTPIPDPSVPRTRTRSRPSVLGTPTPVTPAASISTAPPTPSPLGQVENVASSSKAPRQSVEAKTHGLRSVLGERERTPCPFPGEYGGREKCGVSEEDEKDEVLMALAAACAKMDNRAISAEEAASIAIDEGWLRPPSAAIIPAAVINNAIRSHQKRSSSATPPRPCLLHKYQLSGSVNESVLEAALHPAAFSGAARPKGPVWFLAPVGKVKWKNPFAGIDVPKVPVRKPGPPKRVKDVKPKPGPPRAESKEKDKDKGKAKIAPAAPVKIRLVVGSHPTPEEDDVASEAGSSSMGSGSASRRGSVVQGDESTMPIAIKSIPAARRVKSYIDSSDESDTSDSDVEATSGPSRNSARPIKIRKERPPPLPLNGTNPARSSFSQHLSRSLGSPFLDWSGNGVPPSPTQSISSPFPSHSLDNTTWTVRHEVDRFAAFETSSSSSDDEMRDSVDWGTASGFMIRSADDTEDIKPVWSAEDEEAKIREATDALRVLFPLSSEGDVEVSDDQIHFNRLDNQPTASDTSSITESASTATVIRGGPLKTAELACLTAWNGISSPVASPNFRSISHPLPDTSPTQHLSKLSHSFDAGDMDIDESPWLDEAGELPVKAEDTFSDIELDADALSNVDDMPTPEHDRQLNTAAWAREAAASSSFRVKEENVDYPSPLTTESDDIGAAEFRASRAGSTESHTPSSGLSELPPYELEADRVVDRPDVDEVLVGPESISMEELDGWFPGMTRPDKTPQRNRGSKGKLNKDRSEFSRCNGPWGGIGVGILGEAPDSPASPVNVKSKGSRAELRRRSSARTPQVNRVVTSLPTPPAEVDMGTSVQSCPKDPCDMDLDAIGPDDLEAACAEAKKREERHRKACKEQAEKQKALFDAYRDKVREGQLSGRNPHDISPPAGWDHTSPWYEASAGPWGSSDSSRVQTPSALSPMALHMSALSLDTPMYASMDPSSLKSPPVLPSAVGMLGEVSSQLEADTAIAGKAAPSSANSSTPKPTNAALQAPIPSKPSVTQLPPLAPRPVAPSVSVIPAADSASSTTPSPASTKANPPKTQAPQASKPRSPADLKPPTLAPRPTPSPTSATPSPSPVSRASPAARPTALENAKPAVPVSAASASATAVSRPAAQGAAAPTAPAPQGQTAAPAALDTPAKAKAARAAQETSKKPPPSENSLIPPPTGAPPSKPQGAITKPLCDGIDACVVDNIPVYAHVSEIRGLKYTLLRRLDTDFVNATSLLSALGVTAAKQAEVLFEPSTWLKSHTAVSTHCSANGGLHSAGVPGIWVPFPEARALAQKFKMSNDTLMSNILREDLFHLFAILACINPEHSPGEAFGLPFVYKPHPQPGSQNNSSANSSSSSLSSSSANSKSAPNLPALSASASAVPPSRASAAHLKGPLVRSAPPTPPDGCPQPKRRRATMSLAGEISPLAKVSSVTGPIAAANGKKPPPRATRASIAGDTPKPRLVK